MIKILERGSKQYFIDKFEKSKHLKSIKDIKSDKIMLIALPEDELRTLKQNRAVHGLIGELYKSGLSSFDDYNSCRDYFKEKAGLISRDKAEVHPVVRNIQRKVYSSLTNQDIKDMYSKSINESKVTVRSVSDASREELTLMIQEVLTYCHEVGLNSPKFNEIMEGLADEE